MKKRRPDLKETGGISTIILFTITIIITVLLATVNAFTEPVIETNALEASKKAHQELFAHALTFEDVSENYVSSDNHELVKIYTALDEGDQALGIIVESVARGYGGNVLVMTGIRVDQQIVAVIIGAHGETPGLGSKITAKAFTDKFLGESNSGGIFVLNGESEGTTTVDGISGATMSSRAVVEAVNSAVTFAKENMSEIIGGGK